MKYTVFVFGGEKDGMSIGTFETLNEAKKRAKDFYIRNIDTVDELWCGIEIFDENDNQIVKF